MEILNLLYGNTCAIPLARHAKKEEEDVYLAYKFNMLNQSKVLENDSFQMFCLYHANRR